MDDDFQSLEAELKRLRPAAPSREVVARIERELAGAETAARARPEQTTRAWWVWAAAVALPAAAAAVLALLVISRQAPTPEVGASVVANPTMAETTATEIFKPVAAENVLYAVADEGLVTLDDGTAGRRERLSYVDTITWKNPRTNASVRWTVPREEVRVVPVKFQ